MKKNRKKGEVFNSINELITLLTLLKIKVDSLPENSEVFRYIDFVLDLGKFAISHLHKELMIEEMNKKEEGSELRGSEKTKKKFDLS